MNKLKIGIGFLVAALIVLCLSLMGCGRSKTHPVSTGIIKVYDSRFLTPDDDINDSYIKLIDMYLVKFRYEPHTGNWDSDGNPLINPETGRTFNEDRPHDEGGNLIICYDAAIGLSYNKPNLQMIADGVFWTLWTWGVSYARNVINPYLMTYYFPPEGSFPCSTTCMDWIKQTTANSYITVIIHGRSAPGVQKRWILAEFIVQKH